MSKHWRPGDVVEGPWGRPEAYLSRRRGGSGRGMVVAAIAGAVLVGLGAGYYLDWRRPSDTAKSDAPIEWNAVQAVPTRAPDAEDVAWEKRARREPSPSWGGLGGGEQSLSPADAAGPPPTSPTRAEAIFVIDGDTFSTGGRRIRIVGMDAPETHPAHCTQEAQWGLAATLKLRELLSSGTVTMSGAGHDRYGRELRTVQVNGVDVAQTMISAGVAREYGSGRRPWC